MTARSPVIHAAGRRLLFTFGLLVSALWAGGCDRVPLLAPTESTIILRTGNSVLGTNDYVEIVATVLEVSGTPVQNGTVVTFTTTLGQIEPREARTNNGNATVRLYSGGKSGTAVVRAFSGGATSPADAAGTLSIIIGGAGAERIVLTANTTVVPIGGGIITLNANVTDAATNPMVGVAVLFETTAGTLLNTIVVTDANGNARTVLTSSQPATVTASVGGKSDQVLITTLAQPTISIAQVTTPILQGQVAVFTVVPTVPQGLAVQNVTINWGDGSPPQSLGSIAGSTSVSHVFERDGTFTVTASVRDSNNQTSQVSITVVVLERAPLVIVVTGELSPIVQTAYRYAVTTTTTGAVIVRTLWDFGDTNLVEVDSAETTHVYGSAGHRVIKVHAFTADGSVAQARLEVVVRPAPVTNPTPTPTPLPTPPGGTTGTWPSTGAALVAWAESNYAAYLVAGVTAAQRETYVAYVRDRMIEAGRCGGMDLAWNLKRGGPEISTDYIVHRTGGQDLGVDIAIAYDDTRIPVRLSWQVTAVGTAQLVFYGGYTGGSMTCR